MVHEFIWTLTMENFYVYVCYTKHFQIWLVTLHDYHDYIGNI